MEARDVDAIGALLTDDARWGDGDQPRACRSRSDVVATMRTLMGEGLRTLIYQVYMLRDAQISEIRAFDDLPSALEAAGA
jgi:hypothetical protein